MQRLIVFCCLLVVVCNAATTTPPPPAATTAPVQQQQPPPPPPPPAPVDMTTPPPRPPVSGISIDPPVQTVARYSDGQTMHPLVKLADGRIVSHGDVPTTINAGNTMDPPAKPIAPCQPPACVQPPMQYDTIVPSVTPKAIITAVPDAKYVTTNKKKKVVKKSPPPSAPRKKKHNNNKKKQKTKDALKVPTLEQKMRFTEMLSDLADEDDDGLLQLEQHRGGGGGGGDDDDDSFVQTDESEQLGDALMQVQEARRKIDSLLQDARQELPPLQSFRVPNMPTLSPRDQALLETMAQTGTISMDAMMENDQRNPAPPKVVEARLAGGGDAVEAEDADAAQHSSQQQQQQPRDHQQAAASSETRIVSELPSSSSSSSSVRRRGHAHSSRPESKYGSNDVEMVPHSSLVKQASEGVSDQLMGTDSLLESIAHRYDVNIL